MIWGEIAALGTAVTWSFALLLYTLASRKMGSFTMSHFRMGFGLLTLFFLNWIVMGTPSLAHLSQEQWIWIGLSGFCGFFLCDALLLQSCVDIGPKTAILLFTTSPFMSAFLGYFFLHETLTLFTWLGMIITLCGIGVVVFEQKRDGINFKSKHIIRGLCFAVGAAFFQAAGFALAKPAMISDNPIDPLTTTFVRAIFGFLGFWLITLFSGRVKKVIRHVQDKQSMLYIFTGATISLVFGVWLSMIAVKLAPIGIVTTIMALMPVTVLPLAALIYKEKITKRAIIGAVIACIGVAVLFNT
jgi:drug/metabolite transporter (DMT)-like permease